MRILVALSGGIDSSVVAYLLKEQGHDLIGVRFLLWSDPLAPAMVKLMPNKCCDAQSAARAKHVAADLDIPLHTIDLQDAFKEKVVDRFLEDCLSGVTPNPCVNCNKHLRCEALIELLEEFNCDMYATGHYARVAVEKLSDGSMHHLLLEAVDATKDQSYFLYGLTQEKLSHALFPLGTMLKQDVFELAKHYKIPFDTEKYKESQNLCFFPEKTPVEFLKRYLKDAIEPGEIVRRDGTVVGEHKGLPLYTIGQRRIGVGGLATPLEVVEKDTKQNRLIVDEPGESLMNNILVRDLTFIAWAPPENEPANVDYRTRSLSPKKSGKLTFEKAQGCFQFSEPQSPLSPGQSLVLYRGEEVVGGGIMT